MSDKQVRGKYTQEFKLEAVRQVNAGQSVSVTAKVLGIPKASLNMLTCVRWYVAYPLSLRHVEEMMQERGVFVDHTTVHHWAIKMLLVLAAVFRRRKHPVGRSWRMDETYIKVSGQWKYLYRAVDRAGDTAF